VTTAVPVDVGLAVVMAGAAVVRAAEEATTELSGWLVVEEGVAFAEAVLEALTEVEVVRTLAAEVMAAELVAILMLSTLVWVAK